MDSESAESKAGSGAEPLSLWLLQVPHHRRGSPFRLPVGEGSVSNAILLDKALLLCRFSTETCKRSMTVWSSSMITKDCLHCHPHQRWCRFLHKVPAMLNLLQKPNYSASTRAAWRPGCRFWRITTNSWSHSCTGWGSCWSRRVLRPFLRSLWSDFQIGCELLPIMIAYHKIISVETSQRKILNCLKLTSGGKVKSCFRVLI